MASGFSLPYSLEILKDTKPTMLPDRKGSILKGEYQTVLAAPKGVRQHKRMSHESLVLVQNELPTLAGRGS